MVQCYGPGYKRQDHEDYFTECESKSRNMAPVGGPKGVVFRAMPRTKDDLDERGLPCKEKKYPDIARVVYLNQGEVGFFPGPAMCAKVEPDAGSWDLDVEDVPTHRVTHGRADDTFLDDELNAEITLVWDAVKLSQGEWAADTSTAEQRMARALIKYEAELKETRPDLLASDIAVPSFAELRLQCLTVEELDADVAAGGSEPTVEQRAAAEARAAERVAAAQAKAETEAAKKAEAEAAKKAKAAAEAKAEAQYDAEAEYFRSYAEEAFENLGASDADFSGAVAAKFREEGLVLTADSGGFAVVQSVGGTVPGRRLGIVPGDRVAMVDGGFVHNVRGVDAETAAAKISSATAEKPVIVTFLKDRAVAAARLAELQRLLDSSFLRELASAASDPARASVSWSDDGARVVFQDKHAFVKNDVPELFPSLESAHDNWPYFASRLTEKLSPVDPYSRASCVEFSRPVFQKDAVEREVARLEAEAGPVVASPPPPRAMPPTREAAHAFVERSDGQFVSVDIRSFTGATTGFDFTLDGRFQIAGVAVKRVRGGEAQGFGVQRGDGVYAVAGEVVFESKTRADSRHIGKLIKTAKRPLEIIFLKKGPSTKKRRAE